MTSQYAKKNVFHVFLRKTASHDVLFTIALRRTSESLLSELVAEEVRQSQVVTTDDTIVTMLSVAKTLGARMWMCGTGPIPLLSISRCTADRTGLNIFSAITVTFYWRTAYGG